MRLKVTIDVPVLERIDLNEERILARVGTAHATRVRQRLRARRAAVGQLPEAASNPAGKPFRRTGEAIRAVKRGRVRRGSHTVTIMPRGYRSDGRPNEVVFADYQSATGLDLVGVTAADEAHAQDVARLEIDRQLAASRTGGLVSRTERVR